MEYIISTWNSISTAALDDMINNFIRQHNLDIVSIAHASSYDSDKKCVEYSTSLLYAYCDETSPAIPANNRNHVALTKVPKKLPFNLPKSFEPRGLIE